MVRRTKAWNLKSRIEFAMNSRNQNLYMEPSSGIRGTDSRSVRDGPPNPAHVVEWVGAVQVDLISEGALNVKRDLVKWVQGLKKSYLNSTVSLLTFLLLSVTIYWPCTRT